MRIAAEPPGLFELEKMAINRAFEAAGFRTTLLTAHQQCGRARERRQRRDPPGTAGAGAEGVRPAARGPHPGAAGGLARGAGTRHDRGRRGVAPAAAPPARGHDHRRLAERAPDRTPAGQPPAARPALSRAGPSREPELPPPVRSPVCGGARRRRRRAWSGVPPRPARRLPARPLGRCPDCHPVWRCFRTRVARPAATGGEIANWGREHGVGVLGPLSPTACLDRRAPARIADPGGRRLGAGADRLLAQSGGVLGVVEAFR